MSLYGVMSTADLDTVWTYEAETAPEAAAMYLDDADSGDVVRVFALGRHAPAFVKTVDDGIVAVEKPPMVYKR